VNDHTCPWSKINATAIPPKVAAAIKVPRTTLTMLKLNVGVGGPRPRDAYRRQRQHPATHERVSHIMRNVLVISASEWPVAALRAALGDDIDELRVVVPSVHQSRLQWLTNADDDARVRADAAASSIADALPSQETEASAGDSDPLLAAEDALREFAADEVVVVTRPDEEATWLEEGNTQAIARRLRGLKVTRLVVSDSD
jgi:hypothetical protein